jgi:hypothetical protein
VPVNFTQCLFSQYFRQKLAPEGSIASGGLQGFVRLPGPWNRLARCGSTLHWSVKCLCELGPMDDHVALVWYYSRELTRGEHFMASAGLESHDDILFYRVKLSRRVHTSLPESLTCVVMWWEACIIGLEDRLV